MAGKKLVECIPNFSEGRRSEVIESIADEIRKYRDVRFLDLSSDPDHNRSVMTFLGEEEEVGKAAFDAVAKAAELIDMEAHQGEHPRIGAADVIPFVPIKNINMEECVRLAHRVGKRIAEELGIPVYFYEEAALKPERRNLADIRKGNYEKLREEIASPERRPDAGPPAMHPGAGACVVGARRPLVAFNINLATAELRIAKEIAKRVRAKDGGLKCVKALGVMLHERNIAQVSMNLVDYSKSAMYSVFELVRAEARRYGVNIAGSEIIGLVPLEALMESARYYLQLENFKTSQVLETHLME
ncbi:MAG: glutamate formimidoyltransferase [bacterium]